MAGCSHRSTPRIINEFWTSGQRQAHSLHEVSYRACFKPQLPRFFIERLTKPGDYVFDPFMGRGTTLLEALLHGRLPAGNDINPLSKVLLEPRLCPPTFAEVAERLRSIPLHTRDTIPADLLVFFHEKTLVQIMALRQYFLEREANCEIDLVDKWIRMVAINRLTGHSQGFFSVYSLPPNQAVSVDAQRKINIRRKQSPEPKDIRPRILKKTKSLLRDRFPAFAARLLGDNPAILSVGPATYVDAIPDSSISLVVTSPPFLDVVDYKKDNWLRCWFIGLDASAIEITQLRKVQDWGDYMGCVLKELARVTTPGGHVAFEVGEVRGGKLFLEEVVLPRGWAAGLTPLLVLINDQVFTKTANAWGVTNRRKGTNTNRVVVFRKEDDQ